MKLSDSVIVSIILLLWQQILPGEWLMHTNYIIALILVNLWLWASVWFIRWGLMICEACNQFISLDHRAHCNRLVVLFFFCSSDSGETITLLCMILFNAHHIGNLSLYHHIPVPIQHTRHGLSWWYHGDRQQRVWNQYSMVVVRPDSSRWTLPRLLDPGLHRFKICQEREVILYSQCFVYI